MGDGNSEIEQSVMLCRENLGKHHDTSDELETRSALDIERMRALLAEAHVLTDRDVVLAIAIEVEGLRAFVTLLEGRKRSTLDGCCGIGCHGVNNGDETRILR